MAFALHGGQPYRVAFANIPCAPLFYVDIQHTSLMNESLRAHMLRSHLPSPDQSFSLDDPAIFVATLVQFMFDAEVTPLKRTFHQTIP